MKVECDTDRWLSFRCIFKLHSALSSAGQLLIPLYRFDMIWQCFKDAVTDQISVGEFIGLVQRCIGATLVFLGLVCALDGPGSQCNVCFSVCVCAPTLRPQEGMKVSFMWFPIQLGEPTL
jgi:hypothetical protein